MPDVHAVISLGLGSPADIPHFILMGLSATPVSVYEPVARPGDRYTTVIGGTRTSTVLSGSATDEGETP